MIKIGLLGFGTVGQGVYKILQEKREELSLSLGEEIVIKSILVRDLEKKREIEVPFEKLTKDSNQIINDEEIDVLVEVTGDVDLSYRLIKQAFESGKHVVTANKAVVSAYFEELSQKAEDYGVYFLYEASVAGGIPIIKPLIDQIRLNRINRVQGILNGTCNYILTRMTEEGLSYEEVLKEAQALGYAEADPTSDVEGLDSMRKLRILSTIALGASIKEEDIICSGIDLITDQDIDLLLKSGRKIKLIGEAKEVQGGYQAIVQPKAVLIGNYFAGINGADNSVSIEGNHSGTLGFKGPGAGMYPTANAIITDVLDCVLLTQQKKNPLRSRELSNKNQEIRSRYYIRILRKSESLEIPNDFIQKMIIDNNDIVAFETKELDRQNILDWFESLNDNVFVLIALEG